MKPNLILHIGTEKTGTSSIQEFLYQNKKQLEDEGYHFLQSAGERNNRALPAYLLNDEDSINDDFYHLKGIKSIGEIDSFRKKFSEKLNDELTTLNSKIHTVIISSEHFHSRVNKLESIGKLKKITQEYFNQVKIICYLREQSQVCESWYSTALKNGHTSTFPEFVKTCNKNNIYFNYYENLRKWIEVYKKDINIRVFDKNNFIEGNLIKDFIYTCGIDDKSNFNYNISIENESINTTGQHFIYSINNILRKENDHEEISKLKNSKKIIVENLVGKGQKITKSDYLRIVDEFDESNKKLFNHFSNLREYNFPKRDLNTLPDEYEKSEKNFYFELVKNLTSSRIDFSSEDIDLLRDIALDLGSSGNYYLALQLMKIAKKSRPNGPLIDKKIKEYKLLIEQQTN